MIILYGPDEKEFKSNGFGDLSKYIFDDEVYEEINGIFKFEFSYPMFAPLAQDLKMDNTIRVETPTGEQPFFIIKSNNTNGYIKITAYHIFYKLVWELIEHIGIVNLSAQDGLSRILENTGYTGQSNMTNKSTVTIVRYNVVQALLDNTKDNTFISRYGGEIIRDKFNIEFKTQIGRKYVNNPVEIAYAKNLESYEVELDSSNVATRVMPQGFDGLLLPEKYVLKPGATKIKTLHKEYPHIKAAKDGEDVAEDELPLTEAYEALRNAVLDDFEAGVFDIQANYKISHQELSTTEEYKNKAVLETIYLGDEIRVKHTDEDIDILGRVISYRWKPTTKEYLETELGNYIPKFSNLTTLITMIEGKVQESRDFLETEIDLVTALLNSALGGHVLARNGELFIMDTDDPMTAKKIWRWNLNGLGYSSTGINGPYGTAITMDGTIIGDYIAVNSLAAISANLGTIKAGRIQSKDDSSWWDLDSGEVHLNTTSLKVNNEPVATVEHVDTKFTIMDGEISQKIVTEVTNKIDEIGIPEDGYTPIKGIDYFDGEPGEPGKDGKDGTSKYLHIRYSQNADGSNPTTDPLNAKYIGIAVTEEEGTPPAGAYNWTLIKGEDGQGTQGEPGKDGQTSYLHIKYSDDGQTFTANNGEVVGKYIGTYVDFVKEDSDVFSDYTWNKIRGDDGYTPVKGIDYFDGQPGKDGNDGKSKYLHIRYSQTETGSNPTTNPVNAKYIGIAVTDNNSNPPASSYNWTLIKGTDGTPGEPGSDGQTSYLHIKYSNDGKTFTANNGETVGIYIGTYVDFVKEDSDVFSDYTWNKIRGDDGYTPIKGIDYFDGQPGRDGNDGKSKYLHIRYSQNADGSNSTTNPANAKYIGVAVTESNSPPAISLYNWTLIKGTDGTPGEPGKDGQTSYLHIKYSNDGESFTSNNGETVGAYIGTYVDFVKEDSTDFNRYTWNKVRGDDGYTPVKGVDYFDGVPGQPGKDGKDGKSKYLHIRYSQTETGSSPTTNPANAKYIGIAVTDSNTPPAASAYNWTLIKGTDGTPGKPGNDGKTSYLHIKYSDDGKKFTANNGETVGEWIGTYVDFVKEDSDVFSDYTWNKIAGRSIEKVEVEYAQTTQPDSTAGASWSTTAPVWIKGRYIWSRTKTTYSTGNPSTSQAVMITGSEGKDGDPGQPGKDGAPGRGITSIRPQYYLSTSKSGQIGGSWSYTPPAMDTNKFMWTRNEVKWTNPTQTTWTPEVLSQELEEMKNVISRVTIVENRTTKDSIIGFVKEEKQSNGDPFFARTSEVKQTVDTWTAKFSSIGGRNLLETDKVEPYINSYVRTGYTFRVSTSARGGLKLPNNAIKPGTEYVLSFKTKKISGNVTTMAGHAGSITPTNFSMDGQDVGTSFSCVYPNDTKEHQFVLHFVSRPTIEDWVYIQPNRSHYGSSYVMDIWDIQLEKGNVVTDWTPHPDELYTGITKIDKDGVTVGREGETIETNLGFDGLRINDGATEIASFISSGAVIRELQAETITGNIVNILNQSITLNVGGTSGQFATVKQALESIGNAKYLDHGVVLTINIYDVLNEYVDITGFQGAGKVVVNLHGRINGRLYSIGNSCLVEIFGKTTGNVIKGDTNPFISSADSNTYVDNIVADAGNTQYSVGFLIQYGSKVTLRGADIVNSQDGIYVRDGSVAQITYARGNVSRYGVFSQSGVSFIKGTIPTSGNTGIARAAGGFVVQDGTQTQENSRYAPPPTKTVTETRTFNASDLYTYSVQYGAKSSYYGKASAQNRWNTSTGFFKGRIVFGSDVYNFISGRDSGTTPTVKMRLRRQNSTHGTSASVKPTPDWSGAPSFGGATRGNWTPWVTIPYSLFKSSGHTFSFYNGTTGNSYAIWDRAEVQITRRITQ